MRRSLVKNKKLVILTCMIIGLIFVAIFGESLAMHDPFLAAPTNALKAPCLEYPMGTDNLGRCIFSRILTGMKDSLFSAFIVIAVIFTVGSFIGIVTAYCGGIIDAILMRINVIFQAFPSFILAMAIAGTLGLGLRNGIISLCLVCWTHYARLARSLALGIKDAEYIKSAKLSGLSDIQIMIKHILPNIISPLIVTAALDISGIILSLAGLSFVGLSAQRPSAEWGLMLSDSRMFLQTAPWTVIMPGIVLVVVIVIFNLFADTLRDGLDTKRLGAD